MAQQQSAYPPQQGAYPPQQGGAPGAYPPQQGGAPGAYPPQQGGYPPQQGGYPPQQGGYPPQQGGYPPQQGGYPPQQGGYPPQQGGYPPQQGGYPPQQGGYPPQQGGYPPQQQSMYGGPQQRPLGAYGQQYYGMVDQTRMMELKGFFSSVDKDKSGSITATELMNLQFGGKKFSLQTAKSLVKVFDVDKSGSISFEEYAALHQFVTSMQAAYYHHDKDGSGKLDNREITEALREGGFQLGQPVVESIIKKFKASNARYGAQGLDFEQFLQLSAFLGQIRSTFMVYDANRSGFITINLEQLVQVCVAI